MKIIIGLGNPGVRFAVSRHNIGFLVIESLAKAISVEINQRSFNCLTGTGLIDNQKIILAKPLTFMNLSGKAVASIVKQKKIALSDLLVVCDDVNLPLGRIRIRTKGGDGGHKGLRSIIERLGTKNFPRLRIGMGAPVRRGKKDTLTMYVLGRFNKKEREVIRSAIQEAAEASLVWTKLGIVSAMNKYNRR